MRLGSKPILRLSHGLFFRNSTSSCPSARINLRESNVSIIGVGPRGASIRLVKNATHENLGVHGAGINHRTRLNASSTN
jgi:hypothetical protein